MCLYADILHRPESSIVLLMEIEIIRDLLKDYREGLRGQEVFVIFQLGVTVSPSLCSP